MESGSTQFKNILYIGIFIAISLFALPCSAENVFYRYVNDQGVKVLDTSIPPKYAQNGYEIISQNGQVLEVVPPPPSPEELALNKSRQEILFHYVRLRKRYSNVESIEAARDRRLENLQTSISILEGNITSIQSQLNSHMQKAATKEREGKKVPARVLDAIANSKAELAVAKELLDIRLQEKVKVNEQFDQDIEYFVKGTAIPIEELNQQTLQN